MELFQTILKISWMSFESLKEWFTPK